MSTGMNEAWWERLGRRAWDLEDFPIEDGLVLGPRGHVVAEFDAGRGVVRLATPTDGTWIVRTEPIRKVLQEFWPDFRKSASRGVLESFWRRAVGRNADAVRGEAHIQVEGWLQGVQEVRRAREENLRAGR